MSKRYAHLYCYFCNPDIHFRSESNLSKIVFLFCEQRCKETLWANFVWLFMDAIMFLLQNLSSSLQMHRFTDRINYDVGFVIIGKMLICLVLYRWKITFSTVAGPYNDWDLALLARERGRKKTLTDSPQWLVFLFYFMCAPRTLLPLPFHLFIKIAAQLNTHSKNSLCLLMDRFNSKYICV
jgi:hypothetical protein